eukprot:110102-Amphidinium_carterae.1
MGEQASALVALREVLAGHASISSAGLMAFIIDPAAGPSLSRPKTFLSSEQPPSGIDLEGHYSSRVEGCRRGKTTYDHSLRDCPLLLAVMSGRGFWCLLTSGTSQSHAILMWRPFRMCCPTSGSQATTTLLMGGAACVAVATLAKLQTSLAK